jgi:nitroreductase
VNVYEAVDSRKSIRDFLATPVPPAVIRRVLLAALRAPSGGNVQPWHFTVLAGEPLAQFKALMRDKVRQMPDGEAIREYDIYPKNLQAPYRDRRFKVGEDMYDLLGIPRADKPARLRQRERNFDLFGAPMALFCWIDKRMGPPQWSDLGMVLQTVMLLLRAEGLHSCPQEIWSMFPATLHEFMAVPSEHILFCGMAIGHANPAHVVNGLRADRADLDEVVRFIGVEETSLET